MAKNNRKERKYFTLLVRENDKWMIEFGDYDRGTVIFEQETVCYYERKRKDTKIIVTSDRQEDINAAVDALNAKEGNK